MTTGPNRESTTPLLWLMAATIVVLTWALVYYARDEWSLAREHEKEGIEAPSRVLEKDGRALLKIPLGAQKTSGIAAAPLAAVNWQSEVKFYGSVIDLGALIDLRARYLAARADAAVARAALDVSEKEYRRVAALYADDRNASQRALQTSQGAWKADQARLAAVETAAAGVLSSMRGQWGDILAGWAAEPNSPAFATLVKRADAIVQIAVPFDVPLPAADETIALAPLAAPDSERAAQMVSPAPHADSAILGRTFYYRTEARDLRYGTRIVARRPSVGKSDAGVLVPFSAVVWQAGKSWVYVQTQAEEFERREVETRRELDNGWFSAKLAPGDAIVISGAQLMLSEELKYQIRNENGD